MPVHTDRPHTLSLYSSRQALQWAGCRGLKCCSLQWRAVVMTGGVPAQHSAMPAQSCAAALMSQGYISTHKRMINC
jgi:acid phosphatase family membrane protein YuiD